MVYGYYSLYFQNPSPQQVAQNLVDNFTNSLPDTATIEEVVLQIFKRSHEKNSD